MSAVQNLFRKEAMEAQHAESLGSILLVQPLSFQVMTAVALSFVVIVISCFAFIEYTQRTTVHGEVAVAEGYAKVPGAKGVVRKKHVVEGQVVRAGDVLFEIADPRHASIGEIHGIVAERLARRRTSLQEELAQLESVQSREREGLQLHLDNLRQESARVAVQLQAQLRRIDLARQSHDRVKGLFKRGFYSRDGLQQREAEILEVQGRRDALLREQLVLFRQLNERSIDLQLLPSRHATQRHQLERSLHMLDQEAAENEARKGAIIRAPQPGVVTAIVAEAGQVVTEGEPLLAIVPSGATKIAYLYANSAGIAFVRQGTPVLLRLHAYPYQKFGHARGTVSHVSRVPVSTGSGSEPMYRISVALANQFHLSAGERLPLVPGMRLDAELLLDTRKLYEWAFEPVLGVHRSIVEGGRQNHD